MKRFAPVIILTLIAISSCASQNNIPYVRGLNGGYNAPPEPILSNERQAFCLDRVPSTDSHYLRTKVYNECMKKVDYLMRKQQEAREEWERNAPARALEYQQLEQKRQEKIKEEQQLYEQQKIEEERKNQEQIRKYNEMFNF